jgi:DNA-binding MarR family transcriptional regulator
MMKTAVKPTPEADLPGASAAEICNCTAVRQAARHVTRFYDACLAEIGLRCTQYVILSRLDGGGPMTMAELAACMAMDRSTMGHNLRPLERDGLVTIATGQADRRARLVSLTAEGQARAAQARIAWCEAQRKFEARFGAGRAEAMRVIMAEVVATELAPA